MVLEYLQGLFGDRYGCDPQDVEMAASLDELNITKDDLDEIALCLGELYGTVIPMEDLYAFETVEDLVGYVEDRL